MVDPAVTSSTNRTGLGIARQAVLALVLGSLADEALRFYVQDVGHFVLGY